MSKKSVTLRFDLSIPRQKRAYEILMNEKAEKGIPHNLVCHEALVLYARQLQGELNCPMEVSTVPEPEKPGKRKSKKEPAGQSVAPEPVSAAPSYELTEEELNDPYILDNLGELYSDEQL